MMCFKIVLKFISNGLIILLTFGTLIMTVNVRLKELLNAPSKAPDNPLASHNVYYVKFLI